jgi:hypothetical protein
MASTTPHDTAAAAPWQGFRTGLWQHEFNVRDFIRQNYQPYEGDEAFLAPATPRTLRIWEQLNELFVEERRKGVLDVSQVPSSITAHAPGYIDRDNEIIVGLQTEAPLKRAIMPNGGFRMVAGALEAYGYEPDPKVVEAFTKYRKTHNDAVFDAYTADIRRCRSSHVLTGLPDAYGRGRILLDLKGFDPERHTRLTGMGNGPTLEFARRLAARRKPVWVRHVLVPGWTDDLADIERVAAFAAGLGCVERVDVLPFHQMGQFKWAQLGLTYELAAVEPPARDLVERTCAVFRTHGLTAY